jgi:hypothetical protein
MRRSSLFVGAAGLIFGVWSMTAEAQPYSAPSSPPPPPPPDQSDQSAPQPQPAPNDGVLQTPGAYGHSNLTHAVEAPLHTLNITRQKIPAVLLLAMADPYARIDGASCEDLDGRIAELDAALGPDFDEPGTTEDPSIRGKAGTTALALVHGAAETLLPYNTFVGTLSGAQRRDALVLKAIDAGGARRAYLKGLGEAHGCPPPAAPQHLIYPAPPVEDHMKPMYPIR